MSQSIFLNIIRATFLGQAVVNWLTAVTLLVGGDELLVMRRPLGTVLFVMAVFQYSTYRGWKKWLLAIVPPFVWGLVWMWLIGEL